MVKGSPDRFRTDVWTGAAKADALEPMRKKRARKSIGARSDETIGPLKEAGYTSAIVIANQSQPDR